ncbi:MAG: MFS transporter [Cellvibrionales bacterium]|nr:MFS transporter [Cellvibrionales bacterium]
MLTRGEQRALALIWVLYLLRMLGLFMVLPILGTLGEELNGATPFLLGLALGIYGLAQALLQIPFGIASDRLGRKKVLLAGFALFILGSLVCATAESALTLIIGRFLQGTGAVSAVLLALVADQVSHRNRTIAMAIIGAAIGGSFGLSIVLGPLIAALYGGLQGVFALSALAGLLALGLIIFGIPAKTPAQTQQNNESQENQKPLTPGDSPLSPNLLRLNLGIFSLHAMQMCLWVVVPSILVNELEIALEQHWLLYLAVVGGGFLAMLPFLRMWDRAGRTHRALCAGIGSLLLAALLMAQHSAGTALFIIGLFSFFWGFNLLEATLPSTLTRLAATARTGAATGIYSTCQFMGVFCGGAAGGWLLTQFSPAAVFHAAATLAGLWLALMLPARGIDRRPLDTP